MRRFMFALACTALTALAACGGATGPGDGGGGGGCTDPYGCNGNPPPPPPPTGSGQVTVVNNAFNPEDITIKAGETVTWTWNSNGVEHDVTFDDTDLGHSGLKGSGTYNKTFSTAGTYTYHCAVHGSQGMVGKITVQ